MELGTVLSVAETLLSALRSSNLQEVLSSFGYKPQLDELQDTVETIKAVLRDAETKQELSHQDQNWIEKLKDAVFEADDLFDEFVTLAEQNRLLNVDGSLSKKVSNFFSPSTNPLSLAYKMSCGVRDMRKKLKAIAYNSQFSFKINSEPIRRRRPESCSYVNEVEIIGRENELESIVSRLLDFNDDQCNVSFLSIVGIGGLGKTTLAQLVYNDPRVSDAFQLKMWTCVSDQDQKELDVKNILGKILGQSQEGLTMEQVQSQLRAQLTHKKYLLILDDVWTENRDHWCRLAEHLVGRGRRSSSWIMVTTRSRKTATIIGGGMHELRGLSKRDSWRLFERTVFAASSNQLSPPDELVMIGQKIVDGCAGVPLAIRVAGTLLYGQNKSKWLSVHKIGLANIRDKDNGIMPILKLSFHHLESPLKNCFRYCALFPKDYVIKKEMLISLWMAQGYIVPLDRFQSIEDAGEEYFAILLKRCFFQDIKNNKFGEIKSCKIHDLMHDIAQNVSGKEFYASDSIKGGSVNKNVCHLSVFNRSEYENYYSSGKTHIRSLLSCHHAYDFQLAVEALAGRFRWLRVLDLSDKKIKRLPESIGELLHLRYIDLSRNEDMEVLPNSVIRLCNLQTLILRCCYKFKELPKGLSRLVKLRFLDIKGCDNLTWMPRGMGKLTCLHTLKGAYKVGGEERSTSWKQWLYELEDLKTLVNLKGKLVIDLWWPKDAKIEDVQEDWTEGLFLRSMEHLNYIKLHFFVEEDCDEENGVRMDDEAGMTMKLMEDLQPHSNLKRLTMLGYHCVKLPTWVTHLPYLVSLSLYECKELKCLPCLGNLCHLKFLYLLELPNLEYIQEGSKKFASTAERVPFFPSLELLDFVYLPKFKGWRRGVAMEENGDNRTNNPYLQHPKCLSRLKKLSLYKCPELTCILFCPLLETLILIEFNERLQILCTNAGEKLSEAVTQNPDISSTSIPVPILRELNTSSVAWLNSMPVESLSSLRILSIYGDGEMVELPSWMEYLSTLRTLRLENCKSLKAMPHWMPKLASLRILTIVYCSESLKKRCQRDPPGEDWLYIQHIPFIKYRR